MPDYGHDLQFGIFPSPDAATAERTLELAQLAEVSGPRPGLDPGPPLPGQAPRRLDVAVGDRRTDQRHPGRPQRGQRAVAIAGDPRAQCGLPRPAQCRPRGAGPGRGRLLGRDRGGRRPTSYAEGVGRRADRGDRHRPSGLVRRHRPRRGRALPGQGTARRSTSRPRHPDLARLLQAADAAGHRRPGRRLDPLDGLRRSPPARGDERPDGRAGRGQRSWPAGDPADVQRLRPVRQRQRLPPGQRSRLGRAAGRSRRRRGHQHLHPRHRRRRRDPSLRPRGRPGRARPGRRRASTAGQWRSTDEAGEPRGTRAGHGHADAASRADHRHDCPGTSRRGRATRRRPARRTPRRSRPTRSTSSTSTTRCGPSSPSSATSSTRYAAACSRSARPAR